MNIHEPEKKEIKVDIQTQVSHCIYTICTGFCQSDALIPSDPFPCSTHTRIHL